MSLQLKQLRNLSTGLIMKQLLFITLISLLFHGCKSTTAVQDPEPHYEKYCVQYIEAKTHHQLEAFQTSDLKLDHRTLLNLPDCEVTPYPLVYLNIGEEVTNDSETTPLKVANAISETSNYPFIKETDKEIVKLGKQLTIKLSKEKNNKDLVLVIKSQNQTLIRLDRSEVTYPQGDFEIAMPIFDNSAIETKVAAPLNEWRILGAMKKSNEDSRYFLVRLISPNTSKVPSIIDQQVIRK